VRVVAEEIGRAVVGGEQEVEIAIAIEVGESESAANRGTAKSPPLLRQHPEIYLCRDSENMRRLGVANIAANVADSVVDVAVGDDEVQAAIEIEVGKAAAKSECGFGGPPTPAASETSSIARQPVTIEADHFVVEIGDGDAGAAGIFRSRRHRLPFRREPFRPR